MKFVDVVIAVVVGFYTTRLLDSAGVQAWLNQLIEFTIKKISE